MTSAPTFPPGTPCPRCGIAGAANRRFCTHCGAALILPSQTPPTTPPLAYPPAPYTAAPGRGHSPALATLFGLVIPGAGQAYNGQPIKGFLLLFLSALVLPYLYSVVDAFVRARRIRAAGGRMGKGGLYWVAMQTWLAVNVGVLAAVLLTFAGVLT